MSGARATTAVLLHGFLGSPDDWQPIADRLAGRVPCVAPPLADHPTLAALETAIRRSVPGPAVLIGYSMGARLALHLLLRDPDRYRVGVLACGFPGLASAAERAERRRADARLAARLRGLGDNEALRGFLDDWYAQPIFAQVQQHPCYGGMLARRLRIDPRRVGGDADPPGHRRAAVALGRAASPAAAHPGPGRGARCPLRDHRLADGSAERSAPHPPARGLRPRSAL